MSVTFAIIAISYIVVVFIVLATFRFLRDRNAPEAEYYSLNSFPSESQEGAA